MRAIFFLAFFQVFLCNSQNTDQQVSLFAIPNLTSTYIRYPSREASTSLDAVYHNPAGLSKLSEGLHFNVTNQFQFLTTDIYANYENLLNGEQYYEGGLKNYVYPSIYGAYKKIKLLIVSHS